MLLFYGVPIALVLTSIVAIVWMVVSAQRQNREMGIPPWQFSLQSMLIATTLVAVVGGMLAYVMKQ
jgi:hypothetical protein